MQSGKEKTITGPRVTDVASAANPGFRQLLLLSSSSRERRKRQRSVVEGGKLVAAYLDSRTGDTGGSVDMFVPPGAGQDAQVAALLAHECVGRVVVLSDNLFRQASQLADSVGPIAIIDTPRQGLPAILDQEFVYLDRVQDPGNIGTILRTCAAAGVRHVITSKGTAFCWAPKVLRAAMGAHFGLHITESVEPADLLAHVAPALPIRMLQAPGAGRVVHDVYDTDLTVPGGWVFGSEGSGVRDDLFGSRVQGLSIDQADGVESLNVAAAVAISLFEARRQRRQVCG